MIGSPALRGAVASAVGASLHVLDDRAGPAMRDDHRQRIFMDRANVNEMNIEPIDLRDEVRHGIDLCLALAPIVLIRPILRELLHRRQLHALRCIGNLFALGPPCRGDAFA
jgi:hypothetical protein